VFPRAKEIVPFAVYRWVMRWQLSNMREYDDREHRRWIRDEMLPCLAARGPGSVVFVGTAPYTWHYEKIFKSTGTDYITVDPTPGARVWGSNHHFVATVQDLYRVLPHHSIDIVVMIGVYGFGLTTDAHLHDALTSIHKMLKPDGILVLSWNNDVSADPRVHRDLNELYRPAQLVGLPVRKTFDTSLVLDFYQTLSKIAA
jgi:hypothetical protein